MKVKIIIAVLALLAFKGFAQSGKPELTDDLLKDKKTTLSNFLPMSGGKYLYKMNMIPVGEFMEKVKDFQAAFTTQMEKEQDLSLRELQKKDLGYFTKTLVTDYRGNYGKDSLATINYNKLRAQQGSTPDKAKLDSAYEKIAVKKLSKDEKQLLNDYIAMDIDVNNEALFKRSAAYREWMSDYLSRVGNKRYGFIPNIGIEVFTVLEFKALKTEVSNSFIKNEMSYKEASTIITGAKDVHVKEETYRDFMAMCTREDYKNKIKEIYDGVMLMYSHLPAPDFTYQTVDGKMVSLKGLRGKYVYIDVWATWCAPCKGEIPFLTKVEEDYHGKNIYFVSLSADKIEDKDKWIGYVNCKSVLNRSPHLLWK